MRQSLSVEVLERLKGKRLATAESLTGGGIGSAITAVPGASAVYAGGIISYTNHVKHKLLGVSEELLTRFGAVSAPVAEAMAQGARRALDADIAVSVTGLAGPDGDEFGHSVGTVFIGYADAQTVCCQEHHFSGDRQQIRQQTIDAGLELILRQYPTRE